MFGDELYIDEEYTINVKRILQQLNEIISFFDETDVMRDIPRIDDVGEKLEEVDSGGVDVPKLLYIFRTFDLQTVRV